MSTRELIVQGLAKQFCTRLHPRDEIVLDDRVLHGHIVRACIACTEDARAFLSKCEEDSPAEDGSAAEWAWLGQHNRPAAPPLPETCSQCGQPFTARACGPTHAMVAHAYDIASERLAVHIDNCLSDDDRRTAVEDVVTAYLEAVSARKGGGNG